MHAVNVISKSVTLTSHPKPSTNNTTGINQANRQNLTLKIIGFISLHSSSWTHLRFICIWAKGDNEIDFTSNHKTPKVYHGVSQRELCQ